MTVEAPPLPDELTAEDVEKLNLAERRRMVDAYAPMLDAGYATDPAGWMEDLVRTQDEATQEQRRWYVVPYIQELTAILQTEPMTCFPKSRRMMVTWLVAAYCTWRTRYHENNAIFWQSETEDKAAFVVEKRCQYIEDNLRLASMRRPYKAIKTQKGATGRLSYLGSRSYIWGIAEGGDVLRTYTPSILVMDEADFQPDCHKALTAAIPFVEKGAKLILISSSNGPQGVVAGICREIGFVRFS